MIKLRYAVFCYYILRFNPAMHHWLILISYSLRRDGLLTIGDSQRQHITNWIVQNFDKKLDFDSVLKILSGDGFFEQNKTDVAKLQAEVGRPVTELWDTDSIFGKYPHLKTLARNKTFEEKTWPAIKAAAAKQK